MAQPIPREHAPYPFPRGKTWGGGRASSIASGDYKDSAWLEGLCLPVLDQTALGGVTGTGKKMVMARNTNAVAAAASDTVTWESGYSTKRFDTLSGSDGTVDPLLQGTCIQGDLCWIILD